MWALNGQWRRSRNATTGRNGKEEVSLPPKLLVGKFYNMSGSLPETALRKARIETGSDTMMDLAAEAF